MCLYLYGDYTIIIYLNFLIFVPSEWTIKLKKKTNYIYSIFNKNNHTIKLTICSILLKIKKKKEKKQIIHSIKFM